MTRLLLDDKAFWQCRGLSFQLLFTNKCLRRLQLALIGPHIPVFLKESPQTRGVLLLYSNPSLQSSRPPTAPPLKPVRGGSLQLAACASRHVSIYLCLPYKLCLLRNCNIYFLKLHLGKSETLKQCEHEMWCFLHVATLMASLLFSPFTKKWANLWWMKTWDWRRDLSRDHGCIWNTTYFPTI